MSRGFVMEMLTVSQNKSLCLLLIILAAVSFCYADQKTVEVVGFGECADCHENNIDSSLAFKGLRVTIDCKLEKGEMKTRGFGELDEEGKFRVEFPQELVENGKLKEECYAHLHSTPNTPCPAYDGVESNKIAFLSESDGKHTFSPVGKLKFSPTTCTSAFFLWHHYHKKPFFKKPFPKFEHHHHPIPIYKKPLPPPIPIYKKPIPHIPIYKKPFPFPHIPIYKKPCPPFVPIYKKPFHHHLPIFEKPPIPVYEPKPFKEFPSFPHP